MNLYALSLPYTLAIFCMRKQNTWVDRVICPTEALSLVWIAASLRAEIAR
jgi:hypothetical protein